MAATSTIIDSFDNNSINTGLWAGNYGTVSETGGRARITCDTGYSGYGTATSYTWDDVYAQLYPPALASATSQCYLTMMLHSAGQAAGTSVGFVIDQVAGAFSCVSWVGFFDATATPIVYNAATHAWFRILRSGANILFQTAPDGIAWTTRRTLAAPAWLTAASDINLGFECHRSDGTNNFGEIDNVNTLGAPLPRRASYKVYVDWSNNGTFTDAGDDVSARVLDGRTPIIVRYGRDQARALSPTSPAEVNLELNNISRDYSPENTSSPLAGKVLPGRDVYIKGTLAGTDYAVFSGQLDDFTLKPNLEDRSIDATCLDALGRLRGVEVSTELYSGIRTGEALHRLLDAAGWSATARDIDPGATVMPWWWADAEDCFDAVMKLAASEGPSALVTCDGAGNIVFRDRHHRLTRSASLTVQSTWRSSGAIEPVLSTPAVYNHGWKEIVNVLDFEVALRRPDGLPSAVWNSQDRITLSAGETATLTARASNPFYNAIVPVQDVDYTLVTGTANIMLTKLSGQSTTVTILAVGGTAIIDGLQVRATAVQTVTTVVVHAEDTTSIGNYGRRSAPDGLAPVWASVYDAQAIQQLILGKRADRVPTVSVTLVNANGTRLLQQLTRNLSDRVHVVLTQIGLDADCFIEQIQHQIGQGGLEHRTTFGLEKAAVPTTNPFVFDLAGAGFDQGNFTGTGSDNPSTMFLFDSPTQGFDAGVFAF